MGSKSDQTHSKEEILHQELLHTMILMQPPAERIHKHLIALRTYWSKYTPCICSLCSVSFSYSVVASSFFITSCFQPLSQTTNSSGWTFSLAEQGYSSLSLWFCCLSRIYILSIVRIVSQVVLISHLNMLKKKLCFYI